MITRKTSLIIKAVLIVLLTVSIVAMPTKDAFRTWLRFGMMIFFVVTFIIDLKKYRQNNG